MGASYTTSDIVKGALVDVGEIPDGSSRYHSACIKYVNTIYKDMLSGSSEFAPEIQTPWVWARSQGTLKLLPSYNTGTISLALGSVNGTFSVAPTISLAGYYLAITGNQTVYLIQSHTANSTSFTLDMAYLDTVVGSGISYTAYPLDYDLGANVLRLVEAFRIYKNRTLEAWEDYRDKYRVYGTDIDTLRNKWPLVLLETDIPSRFATWKRNEDHWYVKFNKCPSVAVRVDFEWIAIPTDLTDSDSSIPIIPYDFREALQFGAAAKLAMDKRLTDLSATFFKLTTAKIMAMQAAEFRNQIATAKAYGRLTPRLEATNYRQKVY